MKIAVILGTSRSDGNTRALVNEFVSQSAATLFDLSEYDISFYDYTHGNRDDDFLSLLNKLAEFEHWVLASPVYWYSISAQLKVFVDRLSDLLTIEKTLGRQIKGKSLSVLATTSTDCPDCFAKPLELTANYLHLKYKGCSYASIPSKPDLEKLTTVARQAFDKARLATQQTPEQKTAGLMLATR